MDLRVGIVETRLRLTGRVNPLTLAAWNVRSVFDNPRSNRPERRTALIVRELALNKVDSETRSSELGQLEEMGAGYTQGRPTGRGCRLCHSERHRGTTVLSAADISDRLVKLRLPIRGRTIIHHYQRLHSADDQS
ncbi:hypothetical protein SprV_0501921600 [Sparganum proliferum]